MRGDRQARSREALEEGGGDRGCRERGRSGQGARAVLIVLLVFRGFAAPAEESGPGRESFAWQSSYASALDRAIARRRPLLVYFPPIAGNPEPPVLALAARALGDPPSVEGVRVGSDEVESLARKFRVRVTPCLVLVDRRENVVFRWDATAPRSFWQTLDRVVARLDKAESLLRKKADDALRLCEAGDREGAYRAVAGLLGSRSTPPDVMDDARTVEARLLEALRLEVVRILARDGISPATAVIADLERLRASTAHPGMRAEIEAEVARLRTTRIGAR